MGKTSNRPRRHERNKQKNRTTCRSKLSLAFQKTQEGTKCETIVDLIDCFPNFLGCFAQDTLDKSFFRFPCTFLVNVDSYNQKGSHWLAIGLFKDTLEIFDPLGFTMFRWSSVPCNLLRFLHRYGKTREVFISKRIQPLKSKNCAFYSLFYVLNRNTISFEKIQDLFKNPVTNEKILSNFFT